MDPLAVLPDAEGDIELVYLNRDGPVIVCEYRYIRNLSRQDEIRLVGAKRVFVVKFVMTGTGLVFVNGEASNIPVAFSENIKTLSS
jgi:hypothetical protein